MATIALISIAAAFCLQILGYTGTCTQGANEPFLVGAVLSLPLLVLSAALLAASAMRNRRRPQCSVLSAAGSVGATLMAAWLVWTNKELARDTLWLGTSPCGAGYTPAGQFAGEDVLVGAIFVVLPALICVLAGLTFWTALPTRRMDGAGHDRAD